MKWIDVSQHEGMPDYVREDLLYRNLKKALFLHSSEEDGDFLDFLLLKFFLQYPSADVIHYNEGRSAVAINMMADILGRNPFELDSFRFFTDEYTEEKKKEVARSIVAELKKENCYTDRQKVLAVCNKSCDWTFNHKGEALIDTERVKAILTKQYKL